MNPTDNGQDPMGQQTPAGDQPQTNQGWQDPAGQPAAPAGDPMGTPSEEPQAPAVEEPAAPTAETPAEAPAWQGGDDQNNGGQAA
jgi:hypothetical protein